MSKQSKTKKPKPKNKYSKARQARIARGVVHADDGSRTIPLGPEDVALFKRQRERFIAKFGREPGPHDPVFFDEGADTPQMISGSAEEQQWAGMVKMLASLGAPPDVLHAVHRTERIITSQRWFVVPGMPTNEHLMTPADLKEWEDAMQEWRIWQTRADKAAAEGEHPVFVEAIRKTGLRMPRPSEFTITGTQAEASGDSADWFDFLHEYQNDHPDERDAIAARMMELVNKAAKGGN